MYLHSRRAKERAEGSIVLYLRHIGAIVSFDRPESIFESKSGSKRDEKEVGVLYFYFLERQLHVFFIIIIVQIIPAIMHRHEIQDTDILVQGFVLDKMFDEGRKFQNLIQGCRIKNYNREDDM